MGVSSGMRTSSFFLGLSRAGLLLGRGPCSRRSPIPPLLRTSDVAQIEESRPNHIPIPDGIESRFPYAVPCDGAVHCLLLPEPFLGNRVTDGLADGVGVAIVQELGFLGERICFELA